MTDRVVDDDAHHDHHHQNHRHCHHRHHHLTDKVVDDDVLLPGDHVALLLSASSHPVVSVRPENNVFKNNQQLCKATHINTTYASDPRDIPEELNMFPMFD